MQRPLLVIDVQRGNITEYNRFIPGGIASIVKAGLFDPIIFTRYVNTPDSPARRLLESKFMSDAGEAGMAPEIAEVMGNVPPLTEYGITDLAPTTTPSASWLPRTSTPHSRPSLKSCSRSLSLRTPAFTSSAPTPKATC